MASQCDRYKECQEERIESAKFEGRVLAELANIKDTIEKGFKSLWAEMGVNRGDIKQLYFRVGLIAGGTSLVVSLIVSIVMRSMGKP